MRGPRQGSYRRYAIGCAVAWGVLWLVVALGAHKGTKESVLLVFAGWVIGWISATIARYVYPPPRRWRQ